MDLLWKTLRNALSPVNFPGRARTVRGLAQDLLNDAYDGRGVQAERLG
jgi:hypothetical protein